MSLSFRRAVIVGASSGIGEAIALELARLAPPAPDGAVVALVARREAELQRVAAAIQAGGGRALVYAHDVTDFAAVAPLFERIAGELGAVDLLVYASGVMLPQAEGEYSFAKDRAMIEVNLLGAMAWCGVAAAAFEARRGGTILGISSVAGERGRRGNPGYGTSKAGFTAYLEALRNRLSRYGVNVVTAKPGYVDTPMTSNSKGMFWVVPASAAARDILRLARRGSGASGFVPRRWGPLALVLRQIPSSIFRRLSF